VTSLVKPPENFSSGLSRSREEAVMLAVTVVVVRVVVAGVMLKEWWWWWRCGVMVKSTVVAVGVRGNQPSSPCSLSLV
jgi:hypothetical protein